MIALIALMAQIGSYVPATSVRLGMLDSILFVDMLLIFVFCYCH